MTTLRLVIPDMACGACVETITKTLHNLDPAAGVATNLQTKVVEVNSSLDRSLIIEGITKAGYTVQP